MGIGPPHTLHHSSQHRVPLRISLHQAGTVVDASNMEEHNTATASTMSKARKRKPCKLHNDDDGPTAAREKLAKRIRLSLTKPSYVLRLCPKPLRLEHRTRLLFLLRRLVKRHDWVAASGVLSAYLKGTVNDRSPSRNRLKFSVLLELLNHVGNHSVDPTRIKNLYDIWSKKIGSMKTWPVESRYAVNLQFMLFCLMQGDVGDAYQLALCLEQDNVDIDPVSKMMMGLTFYELWYSSIPIEFQWRDSDQLDLQENSHMEGTSFSNEFGHSEWHNTVKSHAADSQYECDSDASVMNHKQISKDVGFDEVMGVSMEVDVNHEREKPHQNFQPGFYLDSEEHRVEDPLSNLSQETLSALGRLDKWLFPLHFPDENSFEEFMYVQRNQPNDYYKSAVKYLQLALSSPTTASAAILPLVQLLLMGGEVDGALNCIKKLCCNSASVLPNRLRAALLENFDRNNSFLLVSCFEDILKKDPTCCDSLAKLIKMHQNGDYSIESLLEMIALHLDATYADYNTWKVFSSCFFKLSLYEEDIISSCAVKNDGDSQQYSFSKTPKLFTQGMSGKSWRLRCRCWLRRHFNNSMLELEIQKDVYSYKLHAPNVRCLGEMERMERVGDLELLTYKAACASYMYGREFNYVAKAYSYLEKENEKDLLLFLDEHRRNSFGFYQQHLEKHLDFINNICKKLHIS